MMRLAFSPESVERVHALLDGPAEDPLETVVSAAADRWSVSSPLPSAPSWRTPTYASVPDALRGWYRTQTRYPEWVLRELERPRVFRVPSTTIGADVKGAYFPGAHEIWMNPDERFAGLQYGITLEHESLHASKPHYTASEEIETRLGIVYAYPTATDQLAFGAYHP